MSLAKSTSNNSIKCLSLVILTLQTTILVLVLRYSRANHGDSDTDDQDGNQNQNKYLVSTAVVMSEAFKLVSCLVILFYENGNSMLNLTHCIHHEVILKPRDTSKLFVPAFLYTIQNNLLFLALTNLDAATYQVTYQLKILTTALFSVTMLGKRLKVTQWISLILLMIGVSLVQWPSDNDSDEHHHERNRNEVIGLIAVLISCVSSGFSGVYFERLVKQTKQSLWIRNFQLALFGLLIGLITVYVNDGSQVQKNGFFQGYSYLTWIVILLQTFGGFMVAIVMKYADNILKGFATSISIILSTLCSYYLLNDFQPTIIFIIGASIVISANLLYAC